MLYWPLKFRLLSDFLQLSRPADAWLVMAGDYGGQICLTVPVRQINLKEAEVDGLLTMLDRFSWGCNEGDGAAAFLISPSVDGIDPEDGFPGGMGGGSLLDGLWLHKEHAEAGRIWVADPVAGVGVVRPWAEKIARMLRYTGPIYTAPERMAYDNNP